MGEMVAFLRGINLGSRNRIRMADLRDALDGAGYEDVRTHLQSGNVLLRGSSSGLARDLSALIEERFGLQIDVVTRKAADLRATVRADPLGEQATDPSRYLVIFYSAAVRASALDGLEAQGQERFVVAESRKEIYAWCPEGMYKSPLMKAVGKIDTPASSTFRNWRTVTKVAEMLS